MKIQSGSNYSSADFAKILMVSDAKIGKTVFAICQALGLWPGQKYGGIVDRPENLHVLSLDPEAVTGAISFMSKMLNAPKEAFNFTIYNLEDDVRKVAASPDDWNYGFWNMMLQVIKQIQDKARGIPAVIVSSLTTMALTFERALAGPPGGKKGTGMDQAKWSDLSRQITEIRNLLQVDNRHCIWEGHIYKPPSTGQPGQGEDARGQKETMQVKGSGGVNFPNNVGHIFRLRRLLDNHIPGTQIDQMYLDTRPSLEFLSGGRGVSEFLDPKEYDLTFALAKLGRKVGRWGAPAKKSKK